MPSLQTRALILRHTHDREHDRMLVVLTPERGQLRLRARGTKKSISKLGGSLEPLLEVDLQLAHGRTLDVITGSVIRDRFLPLRQHITKLVAAQWLLELIEHMTKPDQHTAEVYELALAELHALEARPNSAGYVWLGLQRSAWCLLSHEGFAPNPNQCAACGKVFGREALAFEAHRGFVHAHEAGQDSRHISPVALRFLQTNETPEDVREAFREIHPLLETLIHTTLDQPLRSERVLQHVVRLEQLSAHRQRATLVV